MGRIQPHLRLAVAAAVLLAGAAGPAAADENPLHQQALRLNDVTGKDAIKGKIVELLRDKDQAKKLIAEAAAMAKAPDQPFNYNGAYILAQIAHLTKDFDNSLVFYKLCVEQAVKLRSGQKLVDVYDSLIALFLEHKKYDEAVRACQEFLELRAGKEVEKLKPFVMEQMILALAKQGKHDDALRLTAKLADAYKGEKGYWYFLRLKAEVLAQAGKPADAATTYEEALEQIKDLKEDDENKKPDAARAEYTNRCRSALERVVIDFARQSKYDEALQLTDELTKADLYFGRLKAEILRDAGKLDDAVVAFEDAIEKIGKAKEFDDKTKKALVDRCRYVLSGVFTDLGQIDKAAGQLQALLKENPENSTYNNDLGYIWADHDQNLDESEKLIRKALDLDKQERAKLKEAGLIDADEDKSNAAYLDSLGWVLFKKKQYAEAKKCLLEASKREDGQHVEILDHLADVHVALGEKDQAVAVWKKALTLENVSKRDDVRKEAVRKKLEKEQGSPNP